jgi:hypothetical protein
MRFCFSTLPKAMYQDLALTKQGAKCRLLSFYYVRQCPPGFLDRYVRDGYVLSDKMEKLVAFLAPKPIRRDE